MTQNVCVSVQMDEKSFHDFASFDLLRHNKGWQRPAVFTAILLVCAGICLSQIGKREGAGLLTAVLTIVAIGLPAVYFGTFFANLSKQIKKLDLPRPFYRLELDAAGLSVWTADTQDKTDPTNRYTWNTVYCAYRTKEAVYIYVQESGLSAEREHGCRMEPAGQRPARRQPARLPEVRKIFYNLQNSQADRLGCSAFFHAGTKQKPTLRQSKSAAWVRK